MRLGSPKHTAKSTANGRFGFKAFVTVGLVGVFTVSGIAYFRTHRASATAGQVTQLRKLAGINEDCASDWAKCGGRNWTGATCCSGEGSFCSPQDEWYSQCLPAGSTPFPTSTPAPTIPGCIPDWGQCGGKNYQGPICCLASDSFCSAQDEWYSQCLPFGSTPFPTRAPVCVADWGQCGGKLYKGPTCCSGDGSICSVQDQWYSQCLPAGSTPFPTSGPLVAKSNDDCVDDWGQCGGKLYQGSTCCSGDGSFCSVQDQWYSQCLPAGSTPFPTPAPLCVADWAQCGGKLYTGPTCCSGDGSFCSVQDQWYSQCLPAGSTPLPSSTPQPLKSNDDCVADWGQCGGKLYKGSTCCSGDGSFCSAQDQWYSQCLPAGSTPFPTSAAPAVKSNDDCVADWGQCGGKLYKGPTCCSTDGSFCSVQDQWYSQCLPAGSTPFPTSAAPAVKSNDDCVADWGQCGGKLYKGSTCCSGDGSFCSVQDQWYSQCLPAGSTPFPSSTPQPLKSNDDCIADWGQCGGKLYKGSTCCSGDGSFCSVQDQWYSQCLPAGSTPFPTSGPQAAKSNDDCVADWGQCGGKLYQGSTCCSGDGSFCSVQDQWYSQCLPAGSTPFPTPPPICVADWGQCGGKLYKGSTCCSGDGSFCSVQDEFYSQCLPAGSTPFPTSAPPAKALAK